MCVSNRIGPPVEGDDFFGREKELYLANRLFDSHHSLLLSAPRRIGKSSLAKRLIKEKKLQGWKCVYLDLEEITTEGSFLQQMVEAFKESNIWTQLSDGVAHTLSTLFGRINRVAAGGFELDLNRKEERDGLYKELKSLFRHEEDTFIVIDELTLFLGLLSKAPEGAEKVAYILNWLRSIRQVSKTNIRWLFCDSVGLRNFTASLNLGYTINDLTEFTLDELAHSEAVGLLQQLCLSEKMYMSEEAIGYLLGRLHWNIPYFIQVIFSKLVEVKDMPITHESIDMAYDKLCSDSYLGTWSERLAEYGVYEYPARQILKLLSATPEGVERGVLLDALMSAQEPSRKEEVNLMLSQVLVMLLNDGYIVKNGLVRSFRSPLLRDYWFNTFVQ